MISIKRLLIGFAVVSLLSFAIPSGAQVAAGNELIPAKLYTNIENLLEIACEGASSGTLKVSAGRGTLTGSNGVYRYKTGESGSVEIVLSAGGRELSRQYMPVLPFPEPRLCTYGRLRGNRQRLKNFDAPFQMATIFGAMPGVKPVRICMEYKSNEGYQIEEVISCEDKQSINRKFAMLDEQTFFSILWVEYTHPDGKLHKLQSPNVCGCGGISIELSATSDRSALLRKYKNMPAISASAGASASLPISNEALKIHVAPYPVLEARLGSLQQIIASKEEISAQASLSVFNRYGRSAFGFKINSFTLTVQYSSGAIRNFSSPSSKLTPAMQEAIADMESGDYLEFSGITASNPRKKNIPLTSLMMRVK